MERHGEEHTLSIAEQPEVWDKAPNAVVAIRGNVKDSPSGRGYQAVVRGMRGMVKEGNPQEGEKSIWRGDNEKMNPPPFLSQASIPLCQLDKEMQKRGLCNNQSTSKKRVHCQIEAAADDKNPPPLLGQATTPPRQMEEEMQMKGSRQSTSKGGGLGCKGGKGSALQPPIRGHRWW
jgi:hypothetical protein